MGLLLRPDAYYTETADGAYVLTHQGELSLTGRSVYRLIDRLAPYLDGRHSLAELTASLPEPRRRIVEDLLTTLLDRGVIQDLAPGGAEPRHDFRATPTVIVGSGVLLRAAERAATRSGLTRILSTAEPAALDGAGVVIHVADRMSRQDAEAVHRLCAGIPLYQATTVDGTMWSGALAAAWRRLSAWQPDFATGNEETPALAATVAASQLLHGVLREATGRSDRVADQVTALDTTTLRTRVHSFRPHPFDRPAAAPSAAELLDGVAALRAMPPLDATRFSQAVMRCVDDRVGLVGAPTERDYEQVPLHVCEIAVSDPVGLLRSGTPPAAIGVGLDFATARHNAAVRALACYASLMVDPRRLIGAGAVRGFDLVDEVARPVDVMRAFPALRHTGGEYAPPPGVGASYSWTEAVQAGLLAHCRLLSLRTAESLAAIELDELDPTGTRYLGMLAAIGQPLRVCALESPLGVPTVVSYVDDRAVACASGLSLAEAIRDCLRDTVLHYQSRHSGQPAYAPPELPALPPLGRSRRFEAVDLSTVADALLRVGHRPVVVPLDHDPEATAVLPHLIHVVLDDV